jgi:hypothetical protein
MPASRPAAAAPATAMPVRAPCPFRMMPLQSLENRRI